MERRTRTRATVGSAAALAVLVVAAGVAGPREVARSLEPDVDAAVRAAGGTQVRAEVTGREVTLEASGGPATSLEPVVRAVRAVPGVRSVSVRRLPRADRGVADAEAAVGLTATDDGVAFTGAVPTRTLAAEVARRVAWARGVPVTVDLAVDDRLPEPAWWPGLVRVLDATAQVRDLGLRYEGDVLTVSGSTAAAATRARILRVLEDADLGVRVRSRLTSGGAGLPERAAERLESSRVVFPVDGDRLDRRARRELDQVARSLRGTDVRVEVLGHAGPGPDDALAASRAEAVRAALVRRGVDADRLVAVAVGTATRPGSGAPAPYYRKVDFRVEEER